MHQSLDSGAEALLSIKTNMIDLYLETGAETHSTKPTVSIHLYVPLFAGAEHSWADYAGPVGAQR